MAATSVELERLQALTRLKKPSVRADFLALFSSHIIQIPSLAQRIRDSHRDFDTLVHYLIHGESEPEERFHFEISELGRIRLRRHAWPGNMRELRQIIEQLRGMRKPLIDGPELDRLLGS
jgi:transcriptional regulator with PAS, ATPase and Fis domain